MREILFRGKSIYTGKWAESVCPHGVMHSGHLCDDFIPETVGQFTGLTDKNGKKIFEGDIVKNDKYFMLVEWYDFLASFCLAFTPNGSYHETISNSNIYLEVIGNIHDNPELLGGTDNG